MTDAELIQAIAEGRMDALRALDARQFAVVECPYLEERRRQGHSWSSIGAMVGTSGEAARQRYGRAAKQAAMIPRFSESGVKPGPLERRSRD